jgi:hypothetical protein
MWPTTDGALVRASLAKIDAGAPPVLPVPERVVVSGVAAASGGSPHESDRRGKRWTDAEDAQLAEGFAGGALAAQLADELGRTRSAVGSRLRSQGLTATVLWRAGSAVPVTDKLLAYALAEVPPPCAASIEELAAALAADQWSVKIEGDQVRVTSTMTGDRLDAAVAVGLADPLLMGEASSRYLVVGEDVRACPPGVDAVVVPRAS